MRFRQFLQILVEPYRQQLVLILYHLHPFAAYKIPLLVGGEILLGDNTPDGAILHKDYCVAEPSILNLQRHPYKERPVLRTLHQLLKHCLRPFLQIGVGYQSVQRRSAQRASRKHRQQRFFAFRRLKFL